MLLVQHKIYLTEETFRLSLMSVFVYGGISREIDVLNITTNKAIHLWNVTCLVARSDQLGRKIIVTEIVTSGKYIIKSTIHIQPNM